MGGGGIKERSFKISKRLYTYFLPFHKDFIWQPDCLNGLPKKAHPGLTELGTHSPLCFASLMLSHVLHFLHFIHSLPLSCEDKSA